MKKEQIKSWAILIILLVIVIGIILGIEYFSEENHNTNGNSTCDSINEEIIKCIANKSRVIVSPTCPVCAYQKQILNDYCKNYQDYLEIIDISKQPEMLEQYSIEGVPTWIISGEIHSGFQPIEELKNLTDC